MCPEQQVCTIRITLQPAARMSRCLCLGATPFTLRHSGPWPNSTLARVVLSWWGCGERRCGWMLKKSMSAHGGVDVCIGTNASKEVHAIVFAEAHVCM